MAKVKVTFKPSGRVAFVQVGPDKFVDTETGRCVMAQFRKAQVPAFAGKSVTVDHSVRIY